MNKKIIGHIKGSGTIAFSDELQRKLINVYFIDNENCNIIKNNKIVPIEHENIDKVTNAHYNIGKFYHINIIADLTEDGKLVNFRIDE